MEMPHEPAFGSEKHTSLDELLREELARVVEALVFAADDPLPPDRIAGAYAEVTGAEAPDEADIYRAVEALNAAYEASERTFRIERWAGGFRMATVPALAPYLKALFRREQATRLSHSLMETLAVVAYRQPVTKPEVDFVRGVDSDYGMRKLLEMGLVEVVGRSESLGKPLLYGTTGLFLEQFGLATLENLPTLREIEEILGDPAFSNEKAKLLQLEEEERGADRPEDTERSAENSSEQEGALGR